MKILSQTCYFENFLEIAKNALSVTATVKAVLANFYLAFSLAKPFSRAGKC
jgi:hypothetical protein